MSALIPIPPGERESDELSADSAISALETALRQASPSFHHHIKAKGLDATKLRRGVSIDVRFDKRTLPPMIPGKVTVVLSTALAKTLYAKLGKALRC